jgi:hypothetical protein
MGKSTKDKAKKDKTPASPAICLPAAYHGPHGYLAMEEKLRIAGMLERDGKTETHVPRGPDIVIEDENFANATAGTHTRSRNIGEHPVTLAYKRGQIDSEQHDGAQRLRAFCEAMGRSGKDSTDLERVSSGGEGTPWTATQSAAALELGKIKDRMGGETNPNYVICRAFCGDGYGMADSVRKAAIPFHPNGVVARVCEALDALIGRRACVSQLKQKREKEKKPVKQFICAGCRTSLKDDEVYPSSLFSPKATFLLCGPCATDENTMIDAHGNDQPEIVARYRANLWLPPEEVLENEKKSSKDT